MDSLSRSGSEAQQHEIIRDRFIQEDEVPEGPIELREQAAVTPDVRRVARILTLKEGTSPVGSFRFRVFRFPGDIDFMEHVNSGPTREDATRYIAARLQMMVQRIHVASIEEPGRIYFSELKAGLDDQYSIDGIGSYQVERTETAKLVLKGYNPEYIHEQISALESSGWLAPTEANIMREQVLPVEEMCVDAHDTMRRSLLKYHVVRWNQNEVLQGWKMLPRGRKLELREALKSCTVTKCDVWAFVDNRYIEVTNYFYLTYSEDPRKPWEKVSVDDESLVPLSSSLGSYTDSIYHDIGLYMSEQRTMKAAKRKWMLMQHRYTHIEMSATEKAETLRTMEAMSSLFNSPAAALSQALTDMQSIMDMLDKYPLAPMKRVMRHVLRIHKKVLNHIPHSSYDRVLQITGKIYPTFADECVKSTFDETIKEINVAFTALSPVIHNQIEAYTKAFLREKGITFNVTFAPVDTNEEQQQDQEEASEKKTEKMACSDDEDSESVTDSILAPSAGESSGSRQTVL